MKRKEVLQDGDDDFDFFLSSPATKIRRLDVDLPAIMEEEVGGGGVGFFEEDATSASGSGLNNERAIVLYKPVSSQPYYSPNVSFSVDSDLISGFKDQFHRLTGSGVIIEPIDEEKEEARDGRSMAVVPWVAPPNNTFKDVQVMEVSQEAEQDGVATMDIEDSEVEGSFERGQANGFDSGRGLPQWQQQHCLVPNLPCNTSTPISWFR